MEKVLFITAHDDDAVLMASHFFGNKYKKYLVPLTYSDVTGGSISECKYSYSEIENLSFIEIENNKISDMNIFYSKSICLKIMNIIKRVKPDYIITNSPEDIHNDHRETYKIVEQSLFHLRTWGGGESSLKLLYGEIFTPLIKPSFILPANITLKKNIMSKFISQNSQFNWLELVETLNRFRSLQFSKDYSFGEAFTICYENGNL